MHDAGPPAAAFAGVVLAAGGARRMGGRPKALIEHDGVALVRRVALALLDAGVLDVVVVLGHRADEVRPALDGLALRCALNEGFMAGRASSLRVGLASLGEGHAGTVIALADHPLIEGRDVGALLEAYARRGPARAVVPRVAGERGHPVVLEPGVCREILRADAGYGARHWMQSNPAQVAWFDCENAHYRVDLDSPADLERVAAAHGCSLRWPAGL
jgi:CTP:molybdopterin cytidylyltransferase MocA